MSFGTDKFGHGTFGESGFYGRLFELLPEHQRTTEAEKLFGVIEGVFDTIRQYVARSVDLYDPYKIREDLIWYLAGNYGIKKSEWWGRFVGALRRFIEIVGDWVKKKGSIRSIEIILNTIGLRNLKVEELYSLTALANDHVEHPEIFLTHIGDEGKKIGRNQFFTGEWCYVIGEIGWYSQNELENIPGLDNREIRKTSLLRIDTTEELGDDEINFIKNALEIAKPLNVDITEIRRV